MFFIYVLWARVSQLDRVDEMKSLFKKIKTESAAGKLDAQ
jgi:hypothetical protein